MKIRNFIWCGLALLSLVACKEEDDTVEEFVNWQATNDQYFSNLVEETQERVVAGDKSWSLIPAYTKPNTGYALDYCDYVVAEKLEEGDGKTSPLLSDSVEVHYEGRLLPSLNYPLGYVFDKSYTGTFDPVVASPAKFLLQGVVVGFSSVLMRMHRGDHWRVYIPYQLGYNNSSTSSFIPAYSTLIFDLRLEDFWRKTQGDRE